MTHAPVGHAAGAAVPPPLSLQHARRWLHWAAEPRTRPDGLTVLAKVPYYATGGRRYGDIDSDHARLVTYSEAQTALALYGPARAGLGFALGDGWQGIDLDKIADRPALSALAPALPSYVEASPSGTGVHAIGYGAPFTTLGANSTGIEAYSNSRFFTFTGRRLSNGADITDLSAFVAGTLAPLHAAGRRAAGPLLDRPVLDVADDRVLQELADALRYLDADDRDTWVAVGQELVSLGDAGYRLWAAWSGTARRFPGGDDLERWATFKGQRTGYAGVFVRAEAVGWKNPRRLDAAAIFAGSALVAPPGSAPTDPGINTTPAPADSAPIVPPIPTGMPAAPVARLEGQQHRGEGGGQREASIENVVDAIGPASGLRIAYDAFQDAKMLAGTDGSWRPLRDVDLALMRAQLGRGGFKAVKPEIIRSAVDIVALDNTIDTAIMWGDSLKWDGVPRIDTALIKYYGCEDSLYNRAVGAYLFTALAGRMYSPGCQADMSIIFIGSQGAGKTSSIRVLAPSLQSFGEIDLSHRDDNLARKLRGKLVVEWAEMRGLASRDRDGITAWITRREETWRELYKEYAVVFRRRCIVIGTANTDELLDDPTGERRWLPTRTGRVDLAALERDRDQLWAEGIARWRAGGIEWELAETLAKIEHAGFKVHDEWTGPVAQWLEATPVPRFGEAPLPVPNGARMFQLHEVAGEALGVQLRDLTDAQSKRIAKILRNLGFEKITARDKGVLGKRWRKFTPVPPPADQG